MAQPQFPIGVALARLPIILPAALPCVDSLYKYMRHGCAATSLVPHPIPIAYAPPYQAFRFVFGTASSRTHSSCIRRQLPAASPSFILLGPVSVFQNAPAHHPYILSERRCRQSLMLFVPDRCLFVLGLANIPLEAITILEARTSQELDVPQFIF